jgi:hypothetical protein
MRAAALGAAPCAAMRHAHGLCRCRSLGVPGRVQRACAPTHAHRSPSHGHARTQAASPKWLHKVRAANCACVRLRSTRAPHTHAHSGAARAALTFSLMPGHVLLCSNYSARSWHTCSATPRPPTSLHGHGRRMRVRHELKLRELVCPYMVSGHAPVRTPHTVCVHAPHVRAAPSEHPIRCCQPCCLWACACAPTHPTCCARACAAPHPPPPLAPARVCPQPPPTCCARACAAPHPPPLPAPAHVCPAIPTFCVCARAHSPPLITPQLQMAV